MLKTEAVVIGAGVIGLSIARALAQRDIEVLVLEQEDRIGQGTSSRNSEVIHAGLYYEPGSLKARFCVEGRRALYEYCVESGIPHRRCGKLIIAASPDDDALTQLHERAKRNGVEDVELIGKKRLTELEPEVRGTSALLSGTTGIVDGHALMLSLQGEAENAGATVQCRAPLLEGNIGVDTATLRVGGEEPVELETRCLVNAAGLNAWDVSKALKGLDVATIPPRHLLKGNYFSISGRTPFRHLIYPVPPVPGGLGIHLTFDLSGRARFGPDVEPIDRVDYDVDAARAGAFGDAIRRYWPGLPDGVLTPAYAGIRPRTKGPGEGFADFVIQGPDVTGHQGYVVLYGIESPGLTSSLAIGKYVADLLS